MVTNELRTSPTAFLTNNRIKIGRAAMTTSGATPYEVTWSAREKFYYLQPTGGPTPFHLSGRFSGFNIHVQSYSSIANTIGAINGAVVTGDLALTTQLSGCTVLYSVNGGSLVVAHVQPDASVRTGLPHDLAGNAGDPLGVILALRIARDGGLGNALGGGTFGIFGMVNDPGEVGLRLVGARNVRMHGYCGALGNGYFIGVKKNGNWKLYSQQNNPGRPADGVSKLQRLNP